MKTLELKHIVPYFPYGLKVTFEGDDCIHEVVGLSIASKGVELISPFGDYGRADIEDCKLILRPICDLTKEIEHNGVRITMMEEIAKIERPNIMNALNKVKDITVFNRGMSFTSRKMGVAYRYEDTVIEITHYKDAVFHKKVTHGNDSWVFSYFHNYPAIIDKLLEWHFDIHGLIEKGLAININELNKIK